MRTPAVAHGFIGAFRLTHIRCVLTAALLAVSIAAARAAVLVGNTVESHSTLRVVDETYSASSHQLTELIIAARLLAAADDTYEFVSRPNLPYIAAHYTKEQLAADRIDTVLIINSRGEPIFWRRVNPGRNRGFPDARAFLAELPILPAPGVSGTPGIAEPAMLKSGPALVVAMPIYAAHGTGRARGWLITARALVALSGHPYGGMALIPVPAISPVALNLAGHVVMARQLAGISLPDTFFTSPNTLWISLLIIITGVVAVKLGFLTVLGEKADRLRVNVRPAYETAVSASLDGAARPQHDTPRTSPHKLALVPARSAMNASQARESLQARILAAKAVFRYQPQIDLQTGCVAGVEALLCVPGPSEYRPATSLVADLESAGLGLALFELRLEHACRAQRAWLQNIGHEFAIGVPLSQSMLADAALLPLVQRVLADNQLAPSMLEFEVEESALGTCAVALRTLSRIQEAGISIAIDGFNANHSNLRLLAIMPISKLRIDPWLLVRMADRASEAQLFAGILGAARGLGIVVCATGVSSAAVLAAVLQHGRPLAQGTAIGAPLDGAGFLELLHGSKVDTETFMPLQLEEAL